MNALFLSIAVLLNLDFVLPAILPRKNQARKSVVVLEDAISNCDDKKYVLSLSNFTVGLVDTFQVTSGIITVQRDLQNPITTKFRIEKCADKGNPNSCEYYATWKWDDICGAFNLLPFTRGFFSEQVPPATCPYKKNVYELRKFRVAPDDVMNMFPNRDTHQLWKFRVMLTEKNKERPVACVKWSIRFATLRKRQ